MAGFEVLADFDGPIDDRSRADPCAAADARVTTDTRAAGRITEQHAWIDQSWHWRLRNLHTNACGDFTLMSSAYWHRVRGHTLDATVLSLDIDSLVMHAAAALGARECRWPDDCRVYKPSHPNVSGARVKQVWAPWQRTLDDFLSRKVGLPAALWARTAFDYPRRRIRGVNSVLGPSIERNFVKPASGWARPEPSCWAVPRRSRSRSAGRGHFLPCATWTGSRLRPTSPARPPQPPRR